MIMSVPSTRWFLSGRGIEQRLVGAHRAQVGVDAQHLADAEQAALRALLGRRVVELGQADGAHQRGVGFGGQRAVSSGNGVPVLWMAMPPSRPSVSVQRVVELVGDAVAGRARLRG